MYVKIPKIEAPTLLTVIVLKPDEVGFTVVLSQRAADGMENSVDPDQTAPFGAV